MTDCRRVASIVLSFVKPSDHRSGEVILVAPSVDIRVSIPAPRLIEGPAKTHAKGRRVADPA